MTDDNIPKATPTRKIFTNFRTYMHTWFPFKEEVAESISSLTESTNNTITNYAESTDETLSKKANKTELPTALSQLKNDKSFIAKNDVQDNLNSTDAQLPLSANQGKILKEYIDGQMNSLLDKTYPIGSIYMSINDTNPSQLFGGSWIQLENRFLLGAGSQYNNGATGGSKDAIVVEHNHIQNSHNHTQNPHNHTQNPHIHDPTTDTYGLVFVTSERLSAHNKQIATSSTSGWYTDVSENSNDFHHRYNSGSTTATNNSTAATNIATTATNQVTGESGSGKNMPPYLVVYMWKRVA